MLEGVILSYHYKPKDVACEYCVNSRRRRCRVAGCPWLTERIEAGVVSYAAAVRELFGALHVPELRWRLEWLIKGYNGSFWLNENTNTIPACCCEAWATKRGEIRAFLLPCTCLAPTVC